MRVAGLRVEILVVGLLLVIGMAVPVVAHGNLLAVDSQLSADGTVRVEGTYLITTGWVVLHADDTGDIGTVIGHTDVAKNTYHGNLSVTVDEAYWRNATDPTRIWAVLHYDANGNGQFDPSADPPTGGWANPANAHRLTVGKGQQPAYVLAATEHAQKTNASEVVIHRVALPEDGYLVIRSNANGTVGELIGSTPLPAGRHEGITVSIEDHEYHHRPEHFSLWAVVYEDDGDGSFDEDDHPVSANGSIVASRFSVERTGDLDADHEHTTTDSETAERTSTQPTTRHHHDDHQHEAAETESPKPTTVPMTATGEPTGSETTSPTVTPGQSGFGFVVVVLAIYLVTAWGRPRG